MRVAVVSFLMVLFFILPCRVYAGEELEIWELQVSPAKFKAFGDIGQMVLPLAGCVAERVRGDSEGFKEFTKVFATTMAAVYALKVTVNSKRPNGGRYSFPSGHTASAFAGASFIQRRYGLRYGIPAYVMATLVGISRITSHQHHPVDVICGAGLGIYINSLYAKKEEKKRRASLTLLPLPTKGGGSLSLTYSW